MIESILELPDDILLEFFSRYVSVKDLCRLERVCRRFHTILLNYKTPWKKALTRLTNVSSSQLKNAAGCSSLEVRSSILNTRNSQPPTSLLEYSSSFLPCLSSVLPTY